jgi:hypothetical protein
LLTVDPAEPVRRSVRQTGEAIRISINFVLAGLSAMFQRRNLVLAALCLAR